jgi:hypothetical protein
MLHVICLSLLLKILSLFQTLLQAAELHRTSATLPVVLLC